MPAEPSGALRAQDKSLTLNVTARVTVAPRLTWVDPHGDRAEPRECPWEATESTYGVPGMVPTRYFPRRPARMENVSSTVEVSLKQ